MKNTIRQNVTTLDLVVFRGNQLHLLITLPDDFVMPSTVRWKFVDGGLYSSIEQPTLSVLGKTIELRLETANLPERGCTHTLYFDDRAVLAGGVVCNRQTTAQPSGDDEQIHIALDQATPVHLQVISTVLGSNGEVINQATSYVHTQATPSSVWIVQHNLNAYPGGITVLDSAGSRWEYELDYSGPNSLRLSFGTASFAGKAYVS